MSRRLAEPASFDSRVILQYASATKLHRKSSPNGEQVKSSEVCFPQPVDKFAQMFYNKFKHDQAKGLSVILLLTPCFQLPCPRNLGISFLLSASGIHSFLEKNIVRIIYYYSPLHIILIHLGIAKPARSLPVCLSRLSWRFWSGRILWGTPFTPCKGAWVCPQGCASAGGLRKCRSSSRCLPAPMTLRGPAYRLSCLHLAAGTGGRTGQGDPVEVGWEGHLFPKTNTSFTPIYVHHFQKSLPNPPDMGAKAFVFFSIRGTNIVTAQCPQGAGYISF